MGRRTTGLWSVLGAGVLTAACSGPAGTDIPADAGDGADAGADVQSEEGPECRNPADCALFFTCQGGVCVETTCQTDADCGRGNRCEDSACREIGAAPCGEDDDCGYRWACGTTGVCTDSECQVHEDCTATEWCRGEICIDRRGSTGAVELRRTALPPLTEHSAGEFDALYGWGGALLDYDGDGDLDVFLGTSDPESGDSPACLYENISPDAATFAPLDGWCDGRLNDARFGTAIDTDQDGAHELIVAGRRSLQWVRFRQEVQVVDLLALLPEADPRRACDAGAALVVDLDLDGHLDLLVGCTRRRTDETRADGYPNLALRYNPESDSLEPMAQDAVLADTGYTLALAAQDVDRDGLTDLLIANDTFTARDESANFLPPGAVLFRCPPTAQCDFERVQFDEADRAWGSFMGLGAVQIDGLGEHIYVSDFGPNRLVQFNDRVPTDRAPDLGAELAVSDPDQILLYGWAVLVDDFDRNGLDDILVTNGHPKGGVESMDYAVQQDHLLLQTAGGRFVAVGVEIGLSPPSTEDSLDPVHPYSSRGGVRFDVQHDGWLDILTTGLTGVAKLHVEQPTTDNGPSRCTLRPIHTIAPSMGHGVGVAAEGSDRFHYRDVQGQIRWGTSPWVLTSARRGVVRFPSGAEVVYHCGESNGPIDVREPEWIDLARIGNRVEIGLEMPWREGDVTLEVVVDGASVAVQSNGSRRWTAEVGPEPVSLMLRIAGAWVPRRWNL